MVELTERQRNLAQAAAARSSQAKKRAEEVPTQRWRTALGQGLAFGAGDEIEAGIRALSPNQTYDDALAEIRGGLKVYKEARPKEALAYEIGGAALPALLPYYGQANLGRAVATGALQGGAYAFNTGEGGLGSRAARVPGGAVTGAVGGGAGYVGAKAVGGIFRKLTDAARRKIGGRGATIVENEIQRLVKQTGRSADDIAQDIIDGRLLAENRTIQSAVRALRAGGGEASTVLKEALEPRPAATSSAALQSLRSGLTDATDGTSQAAATRTSEAATRAAERQAYGAVKGVEASDEIVDALRDALRRVPGAADEIQISTTARGASPLYSVDDAGDVIFNRRPTLDEAEIVRRAIANRKTALYNRANPMGAAAGDVGEVETALRSSLDQGSAPLQAARAQASVVRSSRDAYEGGLRALSGDVNEKLADFAALAGKDNSSELIAAYRQGLMQAIEARAATGSRSSMITNFTKEASKEGMLLREVFPQDQLDEVLKRVGISSDAQKASAYILGGSPTSDTTAELARQGMNLGVSDITGVMSGNPEAVLRAGSKMVGKLAKRELTDAQKAQVARVLVSDNADLVRRAIQDDSAIAALAQRINEIIDTAVSGSTGAGATGGAMVGAPVSGGLLDNQSQGPR